MIKNSLVFYSLALRRITQVKTMMFSIFLNFKCNKFLVDTTKFRIKLILDFKSLKEPSPERIKSLEIGIKLELVPFVKKGENSITIISLLIC